MMSSISAVVASRGVSNSAAMSSRNGTADGARVLVFRPFGRLLAGMIKLDPDRRALIGCRPRPLSQHGRSRFILDRHVARFAQCAPVDHHIAGDEQSNARCGPAPIQLDEFQRRVIVVGAQRFAHGRLAQGGCEKRCRSADCKDWASRFGSGGEVVMVNSSLGGFRCEARLN